jgi:hypothetical protein
MLEVWFLKGYSPFLILSSAQMLLLIHCSIIPLFQLSLPARALQWQAGRNL